MQQRPANPDIWCRGLCKDRDTVAGRWNLKRQLLSLIPQVYLWLLSHVDRLQDIWDCYREVLGELSAYTEMFDEAKKEGDLERCLKFGTTALSKALELSELTLPFLRDHDCHKTASIIEERSKEFRRRHNNLVNLSDPLKKAEEYNSLCNDWNKMIDSLMLITTAVGETREPLLQRLREYEDTIQRFRDSEGFEESNHQ